MKLLTKIKNKIKGLQKKDLNLIRLIQTHNIDCILDVGANVGQYATYLRKIGYTGKIISFEPISSNIKILKKKAALDSAWDIYPQTAVGDSVGTVEINVSNASDMSSILDLKEETLAALPNSKYIKKESVSLTSIDVIFNDLLKNYKNIYLKVDTQGFEAAVLKGAEKSLPKITGIQLELSLLPLYEGEVTFEKIIADLIKKGFETFMILPGYFSKKINRQLQSDFILFKPSK